jgi:hypothetical protein
MQFRKDGFNKPGFCKVGYRKQDWEKPRARREEEGGEEAR